MCEWCVALVSTDLRLLDNALLEDGLDDVVVHRGAELVLESGLRHSIDGALHALAIDEDTLSAGCQTNKVATPKPGRAIMINQMHDNDQMAQRAVEVEQLCRQT